MDGSPLTARYPAITRLATKALSTSPSSAIAHKLGVLWCVLMAMFTGIFGTARVPSKFFWFDDRFKWQSFVGTFYNCICFNSVFLRQINSNVFDIFDHYFSGPNLIVLLFFTGCPSTIFFGIAEIVVLSVQRVLWRRPWSHVISESFIRIPFLAYRNSASSIVFPLLEIRIQASSPHALPNSVKWWNLCERHPLILHYGVAILPTPLRECQAGG